MIGLDTNVIVRFLADDDPVQSRVAADLIAGCTSVAPGFIGREVMVETVWVLERAYRRGRAEICDALFGLLAAEELRIEAPDDVATALETYRDSGGARAASFADAMIAAAARNAGCATLYTFDKRAAQQPDVTLVE